MQLLRDHRDALERVIGLLLDRETIDGADLAAIVGVPQRHADRPRVWAPRAVAMTPLSRDRIERPRSHS